MATESIYCICGQPYDARQFMIQCDACREWFHGSCVGVWEYISVDLDKYHCPQCETTCGPSIFRKQNNWHRHNYSDMNAGSKPVQTGTPVFVEELKTRHFPSAEPVIIRLQGHELTLSYLVENGFDKPILVETSEGLDIKVPHESITANDILNLVGPERKVKVINVATQSEFTMRLSDFVDYFNNPIRKKVLNMISLEFSGTKFSTLVEAPLIARNLDWASYVYPVSNIDNVRRESVSKYCLVGAKDSYTDFHIDFGGTSVWYHVLTGEKIFYLIEPTNDNLILFTQWYNSSNSSETFFGDQVDRCYSFSIKAGNTMLIPTGWIHAVLTPVDTIVFGGNFLHNLNIPMQLRIFDIEKKTKTPIRFRYPGFQTINWYAARSLCDELKKINDEGSQVPTYLLRGVKALLLTLKQWNQEKDNAVMRSEPVPPSVQGPKLIKNINKEIKIAERIRNTVNPPKPERESKRKKKKPINKDFVDFSHPLHVSQAVGVMQESKEPLKLSMKVLNKKSSEMEIAPAPRPPLKLTLPKPSMYPYPSLSKKSYIDNINPNLKKTLDAKKYDTKKFDTKKCDIKKGDFKKNNTKKCVTKKCDNKKCDHKKCEASESWFIANGNTPNVILHPEETILKVKISKLPDGELTPCQPITKSNEAIQEIINHSFLGHTSTILNVNHHHNILKPVDSIYDFHDDSENEMDENCLTIDETPRKKRWTKTLSTDHTTKKTKKLQSYAIIKVTKKPGGPSLMVEDSPKNGIEELIKASCYTRDQSPKSDDLGTGRTSPSTREAIAGMLSISRMFLDEKESASSTGSDGIDTSRRRKRRSSSIDDFDENMDKVHQDNDYIYPSLDISDDDDSERVIKLNKRKIDEAWNPKARVGHVIPKTDRPCREGAKKQAVEKGLEAAAAKRAGLPPPKRAYYRKKPKLLETEPQASSSTSSQFLPSNMKISLDLKGQRKPKKGMATAKQRLGRILKIHKMIH